MSETKNVPYVLIHKDPMVQIIPIYNNWVIKLKKITYLFLLGTLPGRTSTIVNNRIRRNTTVYMIVLRSYISVSYTETYGDIRREKRSFAVLVHGARIQSPFSSIYDRIAPYTVTEIYDRNTITCITAKYGPIWSYRERLRS